MIDHVQRFTLMHFAVVGLLVAVAVVFTLLRAYGRHLERRTREHSVSRSLRP